MTPIRVASAQDFSKLLTSIDNFSVFGRYGGFYPHSNTLQGRGTSQAGLTGYGVELAYDVPTPADSQMHFEVGLGYAQLGGFHAAQPDMDLRATIRDLPSVTVYVSKTLSPKWYIPDPYIGMVTGLMRLQNATGYKTDGTVVQMNGDAFVVGGLAGLGFGSSVASPYVELGYRVRNFPSVEYKETGGTTKLTSDWPKSLNFSGWAIDIGLQVSVKGKAKPGGSSAHAGGS